MIPSNPQSLDSKKYTFLEKELASVLNKIWENRISIEKDDLIILNGLVIKKLEK